MGYPFEASGKTIISQTVVYMRKDHEDGNYYLTLTFAEGSGNVPDQLQALTVAVAKGYRIDKVESV